MVNIDSKNNTLTITIKTTAPGEERESLLRALAAAFRWKGHLSNSDAYNNDGDNIIELARLQEALIIE